MRVERLITHNWGSLEDREWIFPDNTLLVGESGSGKSTLLDALQTIFTAARQNIFQYNIGQGESKQSGAGGKDVRTLAAYALGAADNNFLRPASTTYVAAVFEASPGELVTPFTALIGVEADLDHNKAEQRRLGLFIVRRPLQRADLLDTGGQPVPVREIYTHLQARLRISGSEAISNYGDNKGQYLQHLYGRFQDKSYVSEEESVRSARALVKAMAYKQVGSVHEIVRTEILDERDMSEDVDALRRLMREMTNLRAEAERIEINLKRLAEIATNIDGIIDSACGWAVSRVGRAYGAWERDRREIDRLSQSIAREGRTLESLGSRIAVLVRAFNDALRLHTDAKAKLAGSAIAAEEATLKGNAADAETRARASLQLAMRSLEQIAKIQEQARQLADYVFEDQPEWEGRQVPIRQLCQELDTVFDPGPWRLALQSLAEGRPATLDAVQASALDECALSIVDELRNREGSLKELAFQEQHRLLAEKQHCDERIVALEAQRRILQQGRALLPPRVEESLGLLRLHLPQAKAAVLADLVEPRSGSTWMNAIEGYMGGDRFTILVDPSIEEESIRLVRANVPKNSAKIAQGAKALEDTRGTPAPADSVVSELVTQHPVAKAYLIAQYGKVRKAGSEAELRRSARAVTHNGIGAGGYGMYTCYLRDDELFFGAKSRQLQLENVERNLAEQTRRTAQLATLAKQFLSMGRRLDSLGYDPIRPSLETALLETARREQALAALARLDLSSIAELQAEVARTDADLKVIDSEKEEAKILESGARGRLAAAERERSTLQNGLPLREVDFTSAKMIFVRLVKTGAVATSEATLLEDAKAFAEEHNLEDARMNGPTSGYGANYEAGMRELLPRVEGYAGGVRREDERIRYEAGPRPIDRFDEGLLPVVSLREQVQAQRDRQQLKDMVENGRRLAKANESFNDVFTASFCFKVRRHIREGQEVLQGLKRQMQSMKFGFDEYHLEWGWDPKYAKYNDFFETLDRVTDDRDRSQANLFEYTGFTDEQRAVAIELRDLLLSPNQTSAETELQRLADYRNYRKYDIIRKGASGETALSTWGTGSGGELETPFYLVRASVLAHTFGLFAKGRASALRVMLSDEAFRNMDSSRSISAIRFMASQLGLQLIVAMPTDKAGAIRPEFSKELNFSKVEAQVDGKKMFISEAHEKVLKKEALSALWDTHRTLVREQARQDFDGRARLAQQEIGLEAAQDGSAGDAGGSE